MQRTIKSCARGSSLSNCEADAAALDVTHSPYMPSCTHASQPIAVSWAQLACPCKKLTATHTPPEETRGSTQIPRGMHLRGPPSHCDDSYSGDEAQAPPNIDRAVRTACLPGAEPSWCTASVRRPLCTGAGLWERYPGPDADGGVGERFLGTVAHQWS